MNQAVSIQESRAILPCLMGATPAERIRELHAAGVHYGRMGIACFIFAGWELAKAKSEMGYGEWGAFLRQAGVSKDTARRYMALYAATAGREREAAQIPLAENLTQTELETATLGLEQKSVTEVYSDAGIIKRNRAWGGKRENSGRKTSTEAAAIARELDSIIEDGSGQWGAAQLALESLATIKWGAIAPGNRELARAALEKALAAIVACENGGGANG